MGPKELQDILDNKYYETVKENIGGGGQGAISILEGLDNEAYASKSISKNSLWPKHESYKNLRHEYNILEKLKSCPHVIRVKNFMDQGMDSKIIIELAKGGDLLDYLEYLMQNRLVMKEQTLASYITQLIEALACCHQRHIYHFDLKPENVVFLDKERTKLALIDFGLSQQSDDNKCYSTQGTPEFMAPEVNNPHIVKNCEKVDLYGLGRVINMMMNHTLFKTDDGKKQMNKLVFHLSDPDYNLRWGWKETSNFLEPYD